MSFVAPVFSFLSGSSGPFAASSSNPIRVPILKKKTPSYLEETPLGSNAKQGESRQSKLPLFVQLNSHKILKTLPISTDSTLPTAW